MFPQKSPGKPRDVLTNIYRARTVGLSDNSCSAANCLKVTHRRLFYRSRLFVVLIHRRSTQAFPERTREVREVPANKDNVLNLHKTEHLKGTKYFVHWIIRSDKNCFKSHKARTYVDKDRCHEITPCFGSKYLHWWMVGKKFSRILGRMEYFLSRMRRR